MKLPLHALSIIGAVTLTALFGMVLGGLFGYASGLIAPSFFENFLLMENAPVKLDSLGFAVVLGAFGGTICGGCLGAFAILIQAFIAWVERSSTGAE